MAIAVFYTKSLINDSYYQFSFILKALIVAITISIGAITYLICSIFMGIVTKKEISKLKEKF
jgi:hypothetical protein